MALTINNNSYQSTQLSSALPGRGDTTKADQNLQNAQTEQQQAVQRRRDAQVEMTQAEDHLREAREREEEASKQVLAAQAEQQKAQRSQTLQTRGELINITV